MFTHNPDCSQKQPRIGKRAAQGFRSAEPARYSVKSASIFFLSDQRVNAAQLAQFGKESTVATVDILQYQNDAVKAYAGVHMFLEYARDAHHQRDCIG